MSYPRPSAKTKNYTTCPLIKILHSYTPTILRSYFDLVTYSKLVTYINLTYTALTDTTLTYTALTYITLTYTTLPYTTLTYITLTTPQPRLRSRPSRARQDRV